MKALHCQMCRKYFKKKIWICKTLAKFALMQPIFFRVKDINITEIFYKIQNFLRTLWPSLILTKDLVLLTIWVETFNFEHPGVTNINIHIFVYHNPPNIRISREVEWCPVWKNCLLSLLLKLIFNHQKCLNPLKAPPKS